jgi:hypothetical protein
MPIAVASVPTVPVAASAWRSRPIRVRFHVPGSASPIGDICIPRAWRFAPV